MGWRNIVFNHKLSLPTAVKRKSSRDDNIVYASAPLPKQSSSDSLAAKAQQTSTTNKDAHRYK